jgi:uncharacterized alpha-E superfamily protein
MTMDEIIARGLHEFIDSLQTNINEVGNAVFETFFSVQASETR